MMKKKAIAIFAALCLMAVLSLQMSKAAISYHFLAVNDSLLPFRDDMMPYISGDRILVPHHIFAGAEVWSVESRGFEEVRLYSGTRQVDFFVESGITQNQFGAELPWPSPMIIGNKFYVPLHQVCEYFGLDYELIEVGRSVIPGRQIWIIRIVSEARLSSSEFVNRYRNELLASYEEYFPPPSTDVSSPPETPEQLPEYTDVTIYLSFYGITPYTEQILGMLGTSFQYGYRAIFYASASDIQNSPGIIRKIAGTGHSIGIWLEEGSYDEYLEASAVLFEAAKARTVLVASDSADAMETAESHGLVYHSADLSIGGETPGTPTSLPPSPTTAAAVTNSLPTTPNQSRHIRFACTETTIPILQGLLSHLYTYNYTLAITNETT